MNKYLILPANSDLNRGDQALIWQTRDVAQKAGFIGDYYMLTEDKELTKQSKKEGFKIVSPILKHPGRKSKKNDNKTYSLSLKINWGTVALGDLVKSVLVNSKPDKSTFNFLLGNEEKETLNLIKECDAVFVKGGGFIHSSGKLTDIYTIYYLLFHIVLAQRLNKPVYVMPNSFGGFKGYKVEQMVHDTLSKCEVVASRESISQKMLSDIGVESQLYPDLGFFLEKNEKQVNEVEALREKYHHRQLVGITARPYRFPNSENPNEKYQTYVSNLVSFSKWLFENGFLPVFVDHTLSLTAHESDKSCIDLITNQLPENEFVVVSNEKYNSRDLKAIYSKLDFVVGTRFHSVIFSLSEGVPSLAITYGGNKGQGIMKDLNLSEYAMPMDNFTLDNLINSFNQLVENKEDIRRNLKNIKQVLNVEYQKLIEDVRN